MSCSTERVQSAGPLRLTTLLPVVGLRRRPDESEAPRVYALEPERVETLVWLPWRHS